MKILVLCHATVGSQMASPGIRSFNIARVLQKQVPGARVTLAIPATTPSDFDASRVDFAFTRFDSRSLLKLTREHDVIISTRFPLKMLPFAAGKRLVLDLYTPFFTEWMEMTKDDPGQAHRRAWLETKRKDLITQLAAADVVLCANERQRDLLAGIMGTMGLITPRAYDENPTLDRLIKIAPLGMRDAAPVQGTRLLRGVRPGVGEDDFIIIWNGIIVEWYDLDSLLRAIHRVSQRRSDVRLFFMGTEHPDSHGSKPLEGLGGGATKAAIRLCEELGILDKNVFFNFTWATNDDTQQYLLESDIGVCTYFDSLETRYSFRVRYLDLLWAELPIVCTRGDVISDMVAAHTLGISVPEGDVGAIAAAIERLAADREFRALCKRNLHGMREEFTWERTLAPLAQFCADPKEKLVHRTEQLLPVATHALDWLGSRAHYAVRFGIRNALRDRRSRSGRRGT